jgi:putative addiction module killer protein
MTDAVGLQVFHYQTGDGIRPFEEWLTELKADRRARAAILTRIDRVERGLMGDWKSVGGGVGEMRVDYGPGYRVYFGRDGTTVVILLCGGYKGTQSRDIKMAKRYWRDYETRKRSGGGPV